ENRHLDLESKIIKVRRVSNALRKVTFRLQTRVITSSCEGATYRLVSDSHARCCGILVQLVVTSWTLANEGLVDLLPISKGGGSWLLDLDGRCHSPVKACFIISLMLFLSHGFLIYV